MLNLLFIITSVFLSVLPHTKEPEVRFVQKDKEILTTLLNQIRSEPYNTTSNLVVLAGKSFLETPYVAHTLECKEEQLVVNLRELDCTTYAENCLAIARTVKSGDLTFEKFTGELTKIRYRNGKVNGYTSRLHYFSDWIFENAHKGLIKRVSKEMGNTQYNLEVNFMSTHPESYEQLKNNPGLISEMATKEKEICTRTMYYIPKENISEQEHLMQEGDIIGITTSIKGLDITHVGLLVKKAGRIHLMHASSAAEKVIISEETLEEYLLNSKRATGIMVIRPL